MDYRAAPVRPTTGTAVWEVGKDGRRRHNWVERNAFEVYGETVAARWLKRPATQTRRFARYGTL
jgi:hypothetical protein